MVRGALFESWLSNSLSVSYRVDDVYTYGDIMCIIYLVTCTSRGKV